MLQIYTLLCLVSMDDIKIKFLSPVRHNEPNFQLEIFFRADVWG